MPHASEHSTVTTRTLLVFWLPLLATWLMMWIEGLFLAAVIARLADPKFNLAAYGVAFSFALMVEAPIIMMMSASTALQIEIFFKTLNYLYNLKRPGQHCSYVSLLNV